MTAIEVHHVVEGPEEAPVLVLANSLGATLGMWDPQFPELANRFRVVRYDARGHGDSPEPQGPYTLEELGGDVLALLDRLGVDRAHVCGMSIGGLVGMWLAAHAPERIDGLVLCCTSAWFGDPDPWFERAATVRAHGAAAVASSVVGRWFTPAFAAAHPGLVATMRAMIASTPAEGYAACCEVVGTTDLRSDLPSIAAPTLLVAGREDPAVPATRLEVTAAGIPGCRVEMVEAAHMANMEQPAAVTGAILSHLLEAST
jgi:3-oxoadipate enol-lactonase